MGSIVSLCVMLALSQQGGVGVTGREGDVKIVGAVRDESGRAIARAAIVVRAASGVETRIVAGADGTFSTMVRGEGETLLIVSAPVFATARTGGLPRPATHRVDLVLAPATVAETVTVTAARVEQRTADAAASVSVVDRRAIETSPALVADDVLRQVPTFSLFRRTSSLAAHPTAQGVSLRGIGPSGVSRTLVLFDGIPFGDPFGGWIYWTRVPLGGVERIEIVDGPGSSIYGNYALGGVIHIIPSAPQPRTLGVTAQYGQRTPRLDLSASDTRGRLSAIFDGALFRTGGYPVVAERERGAVDTRASVEYANATARMQYDVTPRLQVHARGWHFREARNNGKVSTIDGREEANSTRWTSASGGVKARLTDGSDLRASVYADATRFDSTFLAVPLAIPARSLGRMSLEQVVPATSVGGTAQWSRALGGRHFLTAGADARWVKGESRERVLDPQTGTQPILSRTSGGTQRSMSLYAQDLLTPAPRFIVTVASRLDYWQNVDGHNRESTIPGNAPTANDRPALPARRDAVVSPRVSALYHLSDRVSVWAAAGAGFRAPTLNELYRQFRVGTVTTLANDQLGPERLLGAEFGIRVQPTRAIFLRTTWFDNRVDEAVSNVTIAATPSAVVQQRQNLGRTRVRGLQSDIEYRATRSLTLSAAHVYTSARVTDFAANPALAGRYIPQVPRHRGSIRGVFSNPRQFTVAVGIQASGRQFDDDLNVRGVPGRQKAGLPGYAVADLTISKAIRAGIDLFAGAQNLFGREYYVGTLPTTIGTPRLVHAGVRIRIQP